MTDDESPGTVWGGVGRPPGIIWGACLLLMIVGVGSLGLSAPGVFDPAGTRCHLSRTWLADANTDKKDWNNVDTGGQEAKQLACAEAIQLADQIPLKEKDASKTASVPGDAAIRIQAGLAMVMSLGQAISGWLILRRLSSRARTLAIGFSAAGIVLQVIGIISLGVFVFVVYALAFSPASREIWPRQPRSG